MMAYKLFISLAVCCLLSSVFSDQHSICRENISWDDLLDELHKIDRKFAFHCELSPSHMICEPKHLLRKVKYEKAAVSHLLLEMIQIFRRHQTSLPGLKRVRISASQILEDLKTSNPLLQSEVHEPVRECFSNIKHFLENNASSPCALDQILLICEEMIQRIENCSLWN